MKVRLEVELSPEQKEWREEDEKISDKDVKLELTQMLFEVCEDWVRHGQQPDLEYVEE